MLGEMNFHLITWLLWFTWDKIHSGAHFIRLNMGNGKVRYVKIVLKIKSPIFIQIHSLNICTFDCVVCGYYHLIDIQEMILKIIQHWINWSRSSNHLITRPVGVAFWITFALISDLIYIFAFLKLPSSCNFTHS